MSYGASIQGVRIVPLRVIADGRGAILHMLRRDDPHFESFGEIYFSRVNPGVVKGWHRHRSMTLNYAVPVGSIRLVLYDDRLDSPTRGGLDEIVLGEDRYALVRVPPLVWNAFLGLGDAPATVANCATEPHDPAEIERRPATDPRIPYRWGEISPESG